MTFRIILTLLGVIFQYALIAQSSNNVEEMKLKLNEDGSHYLKWTFLNQVWLRYTDVNPGSTVSGMTVSKTFDIGLRRTRIQFFGQITDHVFFYTQFGQNNFNFLSQSTGNRKLQAFFHDALGEYKIWRDKDILKIGAGLTIANGLSRFSQPSVSTIMTMDVPVFAQATVDQTDEFSRKLSLYARGQLGHFDYRIIISDPFPISTNGQQPVSLNPSSTFAQVGHHKQYQGLFFYNFFDKESHTTPYMVGTYLGSKKILNLEAGFIMQRNAMWTQESSIADTLYHTMNLWSVALYYDAPLNVHNGTALSGYVGYFSYDFGPSYLRYNGIMNPASGIQNPPYPASQGNSFPMFGTGNVIYAQFGYKLKDNALGEGRGTFLPYVSIMKADYERLKNTMLVANFGLNWLLPSNGNKLTIDYQNRPIYQAEGTDLIKKNNKGQIVLQYQVYF